MRRPATAQWKPLDRWTGQCTERTKVNQHVPTSVGVHMGPGNYGLFPVHFLPIFWPHCSLFIRKTHVQFIIYKILPHFYNIFASVFTFIMALDNSMKWKWNESGFRPPLCTYRLNWARRTSWGWWDDWDDTVLQTQDSKFEPWRSEVENATSRSRRLPTILTFTRGWGRNILFLSNRRDREPNPGLWRERQRC